MMVNDATREFIRQHRTEDVRVLALKGGGVQGSCKDGDVDLPFALAQISGWQSARHKLPSWAALSEVVYPPHLSMEQCSSEATARYKAALVCRLPFAAANRQFVDLTGGFGVDFSFIASSLQSADARWHCVYVECQPQLCDVARHNFSVLNVRACVKNADSIDTLSQISEVSAVMLDPARRDAHGGRVFSMVDCQPDVLGLCQPLLEKAEWVVLKLSPMLDWHKAVAELNAAAGGDVVREVHVVSVGNECKELLLLLSARHAGALQLYCANDGIVLHCDAASAFGSVPVLDVDVAAGMWLYEPNASVMKAGCFSVLSSRYGVSAIAPNSHLYVSSVPSESFPGRQFLVSAVCSLNKKEVARCLSQTRQANISVRNFPLSAAALRQRLKLKDGGDTYLFGTTTAAGRHVLIVARKAIG